MSMLLDTAEDGASYMIIGPWQSAEVLQAATKEESDNPLFGMWRDRADITDVEAYVRQLRAPRF